MDLRQAKAVDEGDGDAGALANHRTGAAWLDPSAFVIMLFGAIQIVATVGEPRLAHVPWPWLAGCFSAWRPGSFGASGSSALYSRD